MALTAYPPSPSQQLPGGQLQPGLNVLELPGGLHCAVLPRTVMGELFLLLPGGGSEDSPFLHRAMQFQSRLQLFGEPLYWCWGVRNVVLAYQHPQLEALGLSPARARAEPAGKATETLCLTEVTQLYTMLLVRQQRHPSAGYRYYQTAKLLGDI